MGQKYFLFFATFFPWTCLTRVGKSKAAVGAPYILRSNSMAKKQKQVDQNAPQQDNALVVAPTATKRLPLPEAKAHNLQWTPVAADAPVQAAQIALTSKGTNPKRVRVYGYDNLAAGNGRVPKDKRVVLVAGVTGHPKGVTQEQWDLLVQHTGTAGATPVHLKDNGVSPRVVRRSYRAGYIRFAA